MLDGKCVRRVELVEYFDTIGTAVETWRSISLVVSRPRTTRNMVASSVRELLLICVECHKIQNELLPPLGPQCMLRVIYKRGEVENLWSCLV